MALAADPQSLAAHDAALLSLGLGVAVFAVNFSFLAFQMSPYRTLVRGASPRHLLAALALIALALVPLGGFAGDNQLVGQLAAGLIPLLAYGSFLLTMLAQREAEPLVLLDRNLSARALTRFFSEFAASIRTELRRRADDDRSEPEADEKSVPPPMHEIFYRTPPPPQANDPLEFLVRLANAAITNSDTHTYAATVTRALVITDEVAGREEPDTDVPGYKVKGAIEDHARAGLERIGRAAAEEKVPEEYAERFVIACSEHLERAASAVIQGKEQTLRILKLGGDIAAELIARGASGAAVGLLVVIRQVAERGMKEIPDGEFDRYNLVGYPDVVEDLAKEAIRVGDTEFLYRCFDTLGWMGCAAVRWGASDAGRLCMQALVQLGREARAAELECFWTRCALTPADHVDERLGWIATWVPHGKDPQHGWLSSLETAFSRLRGVEVELTIDESGEKPAMRVSQTDVPHTETIDDMGRIRTVDYSDFAVLKELNLY